MNPSKHYIKNIFNYEKSFLNSFKLFYGDPKEWVILSLLPGYSKAESSLIYMISKLVNKTNSKISGFYLNNYQKLYNTIIELEEKIY